MITNTEQATDTGRTCAYRVLRYTPNLVRDEWVNIGVLVFDPQTGERRLRMIEEPEEYARVRRLHPQADEELLRMLRDDLENRFATAAQLFFETATARRKPAPTGCNCWEVGRDAFERPATCPPERGVFANDLDAETDRLYADHVAPERAATRVGAPGSRSVVRSYCAQVLKQARLWERTEKGVHAAEFTFPGDPMRLDYGYRRNGTRGFVQALSVARARATPRSWPTPWSTSAKK